MKKNAFTNFIDDYKKFIEEVKNSDHKIKTALPNLLTASRLLAPFFILPATLLGNFPLAVTFAGLFALTDAFDGKLARRWNTTSEFGKNLDPICDKFFVLGVTIPFLNNPYMVLTLILEAVIAGINLKSAFKDNKPKSTYLGKGKTVLLSLLIVMTYLFRLNNISLNALLPLIILTNSIQAITAINYMRIDNNKDIVKEVKQMINNEENNKQEIEECKEKVNNITDVHQLLLEYRQLKNSFTEEEKNNDKTIGQFKKN